MRGVYNIYEGGDADCSGSSPHARGLPQTVEQRRDRPRIIPACAGFTATTSPWGSRPSDHPRMRGVYIVIAWIVSVYVGSSPHARGLLSTAMITPTIMRIIPACAGFTRRLSDVRHDNSDHPRMRGVYVSVAGSLGSWPGSSPHARGLHQGGDALGGGLRIIPACAGFTRPRWHAPRYAPDHPRMRGVYSKSSDQDGPPTGSSPHARGLRPRLLHRGRGGGIIPACAGFTRSRSSRPRSVTDHPRMRGVYLPLAVA